MFIAFEGIDGSGKSTVAKLVTEELRKRLGEEQVVLTREPGGTPMAEYIRNLLLHTPDEHEEMDPLTEILLFSAARRQHVKRVIEPALAEQKLVLTDRFYESTIAYQGVRHPESIGDIETITQITIGEMHPDVIFYMDVPVEVGVQRMALRQGATLDKMEERVHHHLDAMRSLYFTRIKEGFKDLPNRPLWVYVDATQSIEALVNSIVLSIINLKRERA